MGVAVKVDSRERGLIPLLSFAFEDEMSGSSNEVAQRVSVAVEALDVGDVQIWIGERPWMVYERKTHGDLLSSLNSGRYVEQRERLKAWCIAYTTPPSMLYLLEGLDESCPRIASCLYSLIAVHRTPVVQTDSLVATARHIVQVCRTLQRRVSKGTMPVSLEQVPDPEIREQAVCAGVAYQKRANVTTPRQCWVRQLCCVPGIAHGIADRIADQFPCASAFVEMVRDSGSAEVAASTLSARVAGVGPKLAHKVISLIQ